MEITFEQRIKNAKLTKTGKIIGEYFLQNKPKVVFQSLAAIADILGVSDISIVRFARAIGYNGFVELKKDIQNELLSEIDQAPEKVNTITKYVVNKELRGKRDTFVINEAYQMYQNQVYKTFINNNADLFEQASDMLINSDTVYIAGWRSRIGVVKTMSTLLSMLLENIEEIVDDSFTGFTKIIHIKKEDCVFLFSFGRFMDIEKQLLDMVKKTGAKLIVVSDQRITPAALAADILIYSSANQNYLFYSNIGNIMIAEIISDIVAEKTWDRSKNYIQQIDDYLNSNKLKT